MVVVAGCLGVGHVATGGGGGGVGDGDGISDVGDVVDG
jgi:hypothetical protein